MENNKKHNNSSRIWSGLVILGVGLVFFCRNLGVNIPDWVISWHTLLIVIGLLVGYKRNFNGGGWLIMVLIGGFFTLEDVTHYDMSKYYFAVAFIVLGLFLIFKPHHPHSMHSSMPHRWRKRWRGKRHADFSGLGEKGDTEATYTYTYTDKADNDVLDSVNVFGGSHQNIYSKNFKGGDVIAIFGGADINMTQADFQGTITLEVVAIFGGMKIIIPPGWIVKSEVTAIFGGMDDKRVASPVDSEPPKVIIIKGVALFGGVDIRNF